jgi:hypothetical protein
MKLLGWTLARTSGRPPIVRPRAGQEPQTDDSLAERMNGLETRMERVELDNGERQIAVLSALEKVLNQLRARERKRERDNGEEVPDGQPEPPVSHAGNYPSAALARRFRRF